MILYFTSQNEFQHLVRHFLRYQYLNEVKTQMVVVQMFDNTNTNCLMRTRSQ